MSQEQAKAVLVTLQMSTNMDVCSDVAGAGSPCHVMLGFRGNEILLAFSLGRLLRLRLAAAL